MSTSEHWREVFGARELAALRLADAMSSTPSTLSEELVAEMQTHYEEAELAELILVCGQANLNNRAGNAAKRLLGPDEPRGGPGR